MSRLLEYRRLRSLGFGPVYAYQLSGMAHATRTAARCGFLMAAAVVLYSLAAHSAQAVSTAADNRVAAKLSMQAAYIKNLEGVLSKCLAGADAPIVIGDEIWMCGATNTRVKTK